MKNFLKTIINKPLTICAMIIILMACGILSITGMSVNLLPDMNLPLATIVVTYPGASADSVEKDVTIPVENAINGVSDIESVKTYSINNASVTLVQFEFDSDMDVKITEIEKQLKNLSLPDSCSEPSISAMDLNGDAIATVSLYGKDIDTLTKEADEISQKLAGIEGVSSVSSIGDKTTQIKIEGLSGLDITSLLIVQALSNEQLDIPFGSIYNEDDSVIYLRNLSNVSSIEDIENLPIELTLPTTLFSTFDTLKKYVSLFETSTLNEFNSFFNNIKLVNSLVQTIDNMTSTELSVYNNSVNLIRSISSLINNNTYDGLVELRDNKISTILSDTSFNTKTVNELAQIALANNIDINILVWLQRNGISDFNKIVDFRNKYNSTITNDNLSNLLYLGEEGNYEGINLFNSLYNLDDINNLVNVSMMINASSLNSILSLKQNNQSIEDSDFVSLLNNQCEEEMVSLIRKNNASNSDIDLLYSILLSSKKNHVDSDGNAVVNTDGSIISSKELLSIYNLINTNGIFDYNLTTDLIDFIRTTDFSSSTINSDGTSSLLIKLSSIGKVTSEEVYSSYSKYNDLVSVTLEVYSVSGSNATKIVSEVKEKINGDYESNVVLLDDRASFINESISNIVVSIVIGAVLAVCVIYLFIKKIRTSLIIAITLPLSVLVSLLCLYLMDISMNMVSLGGLAVGIGMLVDNSIVVLESILKHRDMGKNSFNSAIHGTSEVAGSLFASTLTNVVVFIPILFVKGMTKMIFHDLVFSILFSMVMSLVVAVTVIPTLYAFIYKKDKNKEEKDIELHPELKNVEKKYQLFLQKALRHKTLVCIIALVLFIGSSALAFTSDIEFLPSIDKGVIEVSLTYSPSKTVEYANEKTMEVVEKINDLDNIEYISVNVGVLSQLDNNMTGKLRIQLTDDRKETSEVVNDVRQLCLSVDGINQVSVMEIDGVVAEVTSDFSSLSATIVGKDYNTLGEISDKIKTELLKYDGIVSAVDNASELVKQYSYKIDKYKCAEYRIDYSNVVMLMYVGISGYTAATAKINDESVNVIVSFSNNTTSSMNSINNIIIGSYDGKIINLNDVATITESYENVKITKSDGLYQVSINVEAYGLTSGEATNIIDKVSEDILKDYNDYQYVKSGVSSYLTDAFSGLILVLIISFVLLYLVMACQFESLLKPLIIIMAIPFSFTGGFLALFITNTSLNVVSFIGIIMLMGVIVNAAIVMIDKIDLLQKEGMSIEEAVTYGPANRLRPIMMSSLTTILALIPLSLGIGEGSELMQPMGIAVLGGLLLGTLVTLIIIPCFYSIVKRIKFNK